MRLKLRVFISTAVVVLVVVSPLALQAPAVSMSSSQAAISGDSVDSVRPLAAPKRPHRLVFKPDRITFSDELPPIDSSSVKTSVESSPSDVPEFNVNGVDNDILEKLRTHGLNYDKESRSKKKKNIIVILADDLVSTYTKNNIIIDSSSRNCCPRYQPARRHSTNMSKSINRQERQIAPTFS